MANPETADIARSDPHGAAIIEIGEALGAVLNGGHHVPISTDGTSVFIDGTGDVPLIEWLRFTVEALKHQ